MLRLVIFRHAKAVPHGAAPDFDRALAPRGLAAAAEMGRMLAAEHIIPDLALVSPALRTTQTWEQAAPALPGVTTAFDKRVYEASAGTLLALVNGTPDTVRTLVLVGHNPGMSDLARQLVGHGDRYAFARMKAKFVTAGVAVIDFHAERWADVAPGGGRLDRFVTPTATDD
ncbi:MAG: histidine phosphatase family protein [Alsobacter sp.]